MFSRFLGSVSHKTSELISSLKRQNGIDNRELPLPSSTACCIGWHGSPLCHRNLCREQYYKYRQNRWYSSIQGIFLYLYFFCSTFLGLCHISIYKMNNWDGSLANRKESRMLNFWYYCYFICYNTIHQKTRLATRLSDSICKNLLGDKVVQLFTH